MKNITGYINQLTKRIIRNGPAQTRTRHQDDDQATPPYSSTVTAHPSSSSPIRPGLSTPTDSRSKGSLMSRVRRRIRKKFTNESRCTSFAQLPHNDCRLIRCDVGLIDILPDDLLLPIFDYCVDQNGFNKEEIEVWQTLVHVCRRWRSVVFGSPLRLKLRLVCTPTTPARNMLDVWPALPLYIRCPRTFREESADNILAVLERSNRVYQISLLYFSSSDFENFWAAMDVPFPGLTFLWLTSNEKMVRVLPDSFLGRSAPRLETFHLQGIPFPGLPKLLLSATHLGILHLLDIPHSGYLSPEAMVAALSTLNSLFEFRLGFQSPRSRPERRPPPPTRFVRPELMEFRFKGASEYLEDLVARIDAPRLGNLKITVFNQIIFDMPQFIQFISRAPTLKEPEEAHVIFGGGASRVNFSSQTSGYEHFEVKIPCNDLDWQVSSLEQVFTSCLPHLSTLEGLSMVSPDGWLPDWQDNVENTLWLELLHPFTSVKNLYLCEEFARRVVPALQDLIEDRREEVLPALENIFLEGLEPSGPVEKGIRQFVATREVTGHPITVTPWDRSYSSDRSFHSD